MDLSEGGTYNFNVGPAAADFGPYKLQHRTTYLSLSGTRTNLALDLRRLNKVDSHDVGCNPTRRPAGLSPSPAHLLYARDVH